MNAPVFQHIPVLGQEVVEGLNLKPGGHYLDLTVGGGGHSALMLAIARDIQITAVDQDAQALEAARIKLQDYEHQVHFWQGNFASYDPGEVRLDGILADLGVSSAQFDQPERGFSFRFEAPLDMRMNQTQVLTAAEIINTASETELADLFYHFGEERFSRRIARRIVAQRPLQTTTQLATLITHSLPHRPKRSFEKGIHPATRVFQALRIAVNQELAALDTLLQRSPGWLNPEGRVAIISFHSLEDRRVKYGFREHPQLQVLTKKPIIASDEEVTANPRARSAKLRIAKRLP
jgi:16S rRNA (cytosine1402-N4)-methyltransferase